MRDAQAKTVGQISVTANIAAGFNTDISTNLGIAALNTAMGGTPSHDNSEDGFAFRSSATTRAARNIRFR